MPLNVLFVTRGNVPDYLNDCIYHGLKQLDDVVLFSTADMWFMYDDIDNKSKSSLYGKGFTIYGRLPAAKKGSVFNLLNTLELYKKIRDRFFDLIIYGSIWRSSSHLNFVKQYYPRNKIFLIDGEDHQRINSNQKAGVYFKRENLTPEDKAIYPISFGIPEELVVAEVPTKEKYWATVIPGNLATYVFDSEMEYFSDYQNSRYAITTKKGGWDCLRHYEIMMNGCVPYFPFLYNCPEKTLSNFPKDEAVQCLHLVNKNSLSSETYHEKASFFLEYARTKLTTKELAKYILSFY
jgi:hypothetical protein